MPSAAIYCNHSKSNDLKTALEYPLTAVPPSIATATGELRQSPKHVFRNYLIDESKSVTNGPPSKARWIVDRMATMRSVNARDTEET